MQADLKFLNKKDYFQYFIMFIAAIMWLNESRYLSQFCFNVNINALFSCFSRPDT